MPAAQRSNSGKETQPLLQPRSPSAGTGPGPQAPPVQTSIGRPSPKFLGLYLWQWGLVALAAVCLYGIYLVGAALAWRHGGRRYHYFVLAVGCLSGAWCLVQIAHTLCCPGLMFTTVDTEERHGLQPSSSLPGVEGRAERMEGPIDRV